MEENEKEIMQPADEAEKAENAQEVLKDEQLENVAGGSGQPPLGPVYRYNPTQRL